MKVLIIQHTQSLRHVPPKATKFWEPHTSVEQIQPNTLVAFWWVGGCVCVCVCVWSCQVLVARIHTLQMLVSFATSLNFFQNAIHVLWWFSFPASRGLSRWGKNERKERDYLLSLIFASLWETSASREWFSQILVLYPSTNLLWLIWEICKLIVHITQEKVNTWIWQPHQIPPKLFLWSVPLQKIHMQ